MILKVMLIILFSVFCTSCAFRCFRKAKPEQSTLKLRQPGTITIDYNNKRMNIEYTKVMGLPVAKKVFLDIGESVSLCIYLSLLKVYVSFLDDEMYEFYMRQDRQLPLADEALAQSAEMITYNGQRFVEVEFLCYYAEVVKKDPELIRLAEAMEATGKSICKVFYPDV